MFRSYIIQINKFKYNTLYRIVRKIILFTWNTMM